MTVVELAASVMSDSDAPVVPLIVITAFVFRDELLVAVTLTVEVPEGTCTV